MFGADIDRIDTWHRYQRGMCKSCMAGCCQMPVEVRAQDLLRLGIINEFELEQPPKALAKRLLKEGLIQPGSVKDGIFILAQHSSGDCMFLDRDSRQCTVYGKRPDTCRNHPQISARPGYCAYMPRELKAPRQQATKIKAKTIATDSPYSRPPHLEDYD